MLGGEEEGSLVAQTPLAEVPEVPLILVLREIPGAPGLDPCPQGPPLTSGALSTFSAKPSSLWGIVHLQGTLYPSSPLRPGRSLKHETEWGEEKGGQAGSSSHGV